MGNGAWEIRNRNWGMANCFRGCGMRNGGCELRDWELMIDKRGMGDPVGNGWELWTFFIDFVDSFDYIYFIYCITIMSSVSFEQFISSAISMSLSH